MEKKIKYRAKVMPYEMLKHRFKLYGGETVVPELLEFLSLKEVILERKRYGWFIYEYGLGKFKMINKEWLIPMTVKRLDDYVFENVINISHMRLNSKPPLMAYIIRNNGVEVHGRDFWFDRETYMRYGNHYCYESHEKAYKVLKMLMMEDYGG